MSMLQLMYKYLLYLAM